MKNIAIILSVLIMGYGFYLWVMGAN